MGKPRMIGHFKPYTPNNRADMRMVKQHSYSVVLHEMMEHKRRDDQNGKQISRTAEKIERAEQIETVHII